MRRFSYGLVAALLLPWLLTDPGASASAAPAATAAAESQEPFTVYLAPSDQGGDDANGGLSTGDPINSISRAQEVLRENDPDTDVEIRIQQGTYVAEPFHEWRYYIPGHTISFMPIDYVPGEGMPPGGLPVFRNDQCGSHYCKGYWMMPSLPSDTNDPMYDGGTSGLEFYYLQLERYSAGGISIYGDSERDVEDESYDPPLRVAGSKGLNGNKFFGMKFRQLGNTHSGGGAEQFGYGGIVLTNSSDNEITNNHFVNIENDGSYAGAIHGVYVTHHSEHTRITENKFSWISGDPVKVRNRSNFTTVEQNTFTRTGRLAYYKGEFCDPACAEANDLAQQCASYHNRFFDNTVNSGYDGGRISDWALSPEGLTNAGGEPCSIPDGETRVRTGGNQPGSG